MLRQGSEHDGARVRIEALAACPARLSTRHSFVSPGKSWSNFVVVTTLLLPPSHWCGKFRLQSQSLMRRRGHSSFWPTPGLAHVRWAQKLSRVSRRPHRRDSTGRGRGRRPARNLVCGADNRALCCGPRPTPPRARGRLLARRPGSVCVMRVSRWRYLAPVALFGYRSG
jgi:hypothetical protein